jgi:beta-lactamase regulating signal transducer with metallopeptidase domain
MTALFHWTWQGLLVAMAAALVVRALPRLDGAARHATWWGALLLVLVLPATWSGDGRPPAATVIPLSAIPDATLVLPPAPDWCLAVLVGAWLGWVAVRLARLAIGLREVAHLRARSRSLPARVAAALEREQDTPSTRRRAEVRVSAGIQGACAVGLGRPVILVSPRLLDALDAEALHLVILHEQAHLDRRDDWGRLVEMLMSCLVGLHPAVAWITRQIDAAREVACDDRVVAATGTPRAYARSLAEAAAVMARAPSASVPVLAPGVARARGALTARVRRILGGTPATPRRRWVTVGVCLVAATTMGTAREVRPLVVFADLLVDGPAVLARAGIGVIDPALRLPMPVEPLTILSRTRPVSTPVPQAVAPLEAAHASPAFSPGLNQVAAAAQDADDAVATLDGRPVLVAALGAAGISSTAVPSAQAPAVPGPLGRLGVTAGDGGQAVGRAAARSGQAVGRFFSRAGAAAARVF